MLGLLNYKLESEKLNYEYSSSIIKNAFNNVKEVSYKVLYDFKEVNPRIKLNSFIIFNDNYYILDQDTSKVYSSKVSELKFDSYETKIDKPFHIDNFTKTLKTKFCFLGRVSILSNFTQFNMLEVKYSNSLEVLAI
jgi:hypothetical protein